jgi:preprotein translocase subunit SecG
MENVILIVHLLLALGLIGVVLLQRSEGGGLGMGGPAGAATGRPPVTAMGKVTWVLAGAFIVTSITLTIISAQNSAGSSVLDRIGGGSASVDTDTSAPADIDTDALLPPPASADPNTPLVPRAD